jgi:hypothetical protein
MRALPGLPRAGRDVCGIGEGTDEDVVAHDWPRGRKKGHVGAVMNRHDRPGALRGAVESSPDTAAPRAGREGRTNPCYRAAAATLADAIRTENSTDRVIEAFERLHV